MRCPLPIAGGYISWDKIIVIGTLPVSQIQASQPAKENAGARCDQQETAGIDPYSGKETAVL